MKKQVLTSCGILPALLLVQPRIRQYFTYDYLTEKTVEVDQFWEAPEVLYNTDILTEGEFNFLHRTASKKVERVTSHFYSDYPNKTSKKDFVSDVYAASLSPSTFIYTSESITDPKQINEDGYNVTLTESFESSVSFGMTVNFNLERKLEIFFASITEAFGILFNVTTEMREGKSITISYSFPYNKDYPYITLYKTQIYTPITLQIYKPLAPASYIYYKDFKLYLTSYVIQAAYSKGPFDEEKYFVYGDTLVPSSTYYDDIYGMMEMSQSKIDLINSEGD